jgi:hypothetical protein
MVAVVAGVGVETVIQSQVQGGAGMSVDKTMMSKKCGRRWSPGVLTQESQTWLGADNAIRARFEQKCAVPNYD